MNKGCALFVAMIIGTLVVGVSCGQSSATPTTTFTITPVPYTVEPSRQAQAPWLVMPTYIDPTQAIIANVGDRFAIGLYVIPRVGEHWVVSFDNDILSNPDQAIVMLDPQSPVDGTAWFMFNTLKSGDTKVSFELITATDQVRTQTSFDIEIP